MRRNYWKIFLFLLPIPILAYVGPGAGFAFLGSFLFIFLAFFVAIFNLITLPLRAAIRAIKRLKARRKAKIRKLIILGFDGMDYRLTKKMIEKGELPNFARLAKEGSFLPLRSTEPPLSPVAWSTFTTGVNPGKHNIFDFLARDPKTYMPKLSSSEILPPRRVLKIGKYEIPISKPKIELLRKSKAFWKVLGDNGVYAQVLRVPFTFPPEKFYGTQLAGLGTPDLRGTQGTFTYFSEEKNEVFELSDGVCVKLEKNNGYYRGRIPGPPNPFKKGEILYKEFQLIPIDERKAKIKTEDGEIEVEKGNLSSWFRMDFRAGPVKVSGIAQWYLHSLSPVSLYMSPINLNPEKPAMPLSHPAIFAVYLAKKNGPYATLGMAEDTWGLNEGVLDERGYIQQVYNANREREKFHFDALGKMGEGVLISVFEYTDRIQHMFWRYIDPESPAPKDSQEREVREAIYDVYKDADRIVGETLKKLKKGDVIMIVSDHGFDKFNRGVNINEWLRREGYLHLKEGKEESGKWFADVDWSKTRAYGFGLAGIFINLKGREARGIVSREEAEKLKREIKEKLEALYDEKKGKKPIARVFLKENIYNGPYLRNAPDLIIGYNIGYRVSWESAVGKVGGEIFVDNKRRWSGDHGFTSEQIPGIFFCNRKVSEKKPTLADIPPTVYDLFGVKIPAFVEGKNLGVKV